MEEDIKKIDRFITIMKSDFRTGLYYKYELDAIEHLIKAYKELKEKLDETLNANLALVQGNANSIPVSLVEETIKELEDEICGDDEYLGNRQCIELELLEKVQKELLEKRK